MEVEFYNTPIVEGKRIKEYKGFVNASQVAGTGFFSDLTASFTDIFGGHSGVYRTAMNDLCKNILQQLKNQAMERGANAIIGLHIDYDNISAKGTSMFMVSAQGTAVLLQDEKSTHAENISDSASISTYTLEKKLYTKETITELNNYLPSDEAWNKIIAYADEELAPILHKKALECIEWCAKNPYDESGGKKRFVTNYDRFFAKMPRTTQLQLAYMDEKCDKFVNKFALFDADCLLTHAKQGNIDFVINCLESKKPMYVKEDVVKMDQLYEILTTLPDKGHYEDVKGGFLSSGGTKFICSCGKTNDKENEYCSSCGRNIKGLTSKQVETINNFKLTIDALKELFA